MPPIHLFVPSFEIDRCLGEIRECLETGWTGSGFKTLQFEQAWQRYTGHPYCHFTSSATAGLHLAVHILKRARGWSDGDEVISTPVTFVSSNHVMLYERLSVRFADLDEFGTLDPGSVEERLTSRTRAVMFVGLGGNTGQLPRIVEICRRHGLALILDAAHMSGTRLNGRTPGLDADATVYSFHAVKNLPSADGGMLCFQEEAHDTLARQLSWMGISKDTFARTNSRSVYKWRYDIDNVGFKYHGNSIMAAIALSQLDVLDRDNAYRRQIAKWYDELLGSAGVTRVPTAAGCESAQHLYQVLVENRDETILALNQLEIYPGVHYRDNTEYAVYSSTTDRCPQARKFSDTVLSLPLHLRLSRADVETVADRLIGIVKP